MGLLEKGTVCGINRQCCSVFSCSCPWWNYSKGGHISVSLILIHSQWKCCTLDVAMKIKISIEQ